MTQGIIKNKFKPTIRDVFRSNYNRITTLFDRKVFCIGYNKTGTTSLYSLLQNCGYKFGSLKKSEFLLTSYARRNFNEIIKFCREGNAFKDVPFSLPFTYIPLDTAYRNSRFILTIRDSPEQWYNSITKFHSKKFASGISIPTSDHLKKANYCYEGWAWDYINECFDSSESSPYDRETLIKSYEKHIDDADFYFRNRKNSLLILNVNDSNGVSKISEFLGIEIAMEIVPWVNKTVDH